MRDSAAAVNPDAIIIEAASPIFVPDPAAIRGKRVLVIEDGPTLTHGEMKYGAGIVAARRFGAAEIIDPRPYTVGTITETFAEVPGDRHRCCRPWATATSRSATWRRRSAACRATWCISATPIDLTRVATIYHPVQRVRYELQVIGQPTLEEVLVERLGR